MILSKWAIQPKRNLLTEAAVPSKQVQALEIFFEFEQFVAKAGRDVVAVTVDFVYVSQKVIAAEAEAVNAEAQGSVLALLHPSTRGAARAPRKRICFIILASIWNSYEYRKIEDMICRDFWAYKQRYRAAWKTNLQYGRRTTEYDWERYSVPI